MPPRSDGEVDRSDHDDAPEAPAPRDDAGFECGADVGPCDPVTGTGCAAGQDCRLVATTPFESACGAAGAGAVGSVCAREAQCAAGLHCVAGFCLSLCCFGAAGDAACGSRYGRLSRCVGNTDLQPISACTAMNRCEYTSPSACAAPLACDVYSTAGHARCGTRGAVPLGGACRLFNDCVAGLSCRLLVPPEGECVPLCNPLVSARCKDGSRCVGYGNTPRDWGYCEG